MGGGAGGHNGIRSLDQHIGKEYRRVRIGVGHPGVKELVHSHVLGDFAKADREWLEPLLDAIADNAEMLIRGDDSGLMNKAAVALGGGSKSGAPNTRTCHWIIRWQKTPPKSKGQAIFARRGRRRRQSNCPRVAPMAAMLKKLFGKGGD